MRMLAAFLLGVLIVAVGIPLVLGIEWLVGQYRTHKEDEQ
jgi:hypothetical protein